MRKRIIALLIICAIAAAVFVFGKKADNKETDAAAVEEQARTEEEVNGPQTMQAEESYTITIDEDSEGSLTP